MNAWGAAELSSARTIAGGLGEAARSAGEAGRVGGAECPRQNPPRVPIFNAVFVAQTGRHLRDG